MPSTMVGKLSSNDFLQLRDFLSREFGLFFEITKMTFLENRVLPLVEKLEITDMNALIALIQNDSEKRAEFLDALTTNETWFFRHPRHFDILREDVLPAMIKEKIKQDRKEIMIWSAGSSIGAEAYSIAITLSEVLRDRTGWKIRIIGSDISRQALSRAIQGVYAQSEIRLIANSVLARYFVPYSNAAYCLKPEFESWMSFEETNLLNNWPDRRFDIIFCRNTMIYFKEETKAKLTERFYRNLNPDGYFFTSATETLHWTGDNEFERVFLRGEYVYRKRDQARAQVVFQFLTPADLLRALNLLVKANVEYTLQNVPQREPHAPKKVILVPKHLEANVCRLLHEACLRTETSDQASL